MLPAPVREARLPGLTLDEMAGPELLNQAGLSLIFVIMFSKQ